MNWKNIASYLFLKKSSYFPTLTRDSVLRIRKPCYKTVGHANPANIRQSQIEITDLSVDAPDDDTSSSTTTS